jgi:hypothetical protein
MNTKPQARRDSATDLAVARARERERSRYAKWSDKKLKENAGNDSLGYIRGEINFRRKSRAGTLSTLRRWSGFTDSKRK